MKRLFLMIVLAAMVFSASIVIAEEKEKTFEVNVGVDFLTKYVGSLSGGVSYDDPVIQPCVSLSHLPSGLYGNVWVSYGPKSGFGSRDGSDEIDGTAGIIRKVGPIVFDFYYAYYDVGRVGTLEEGDAHALGARIEFPKIWKFVPYVRAEYDFIRGSSEDNGLLYRIGASMPFGGFQFDLSVAGHTEFCGSRAEALSSAKLAIGYPIELAKNIQLIPKISFQKRLGYSEEEGGLTQDVIWGGLAVSWTF